MNNIEVTRWREKAGYTQIQAAGLLGISPHTYRGLESGALKVKPAQVALIKRSLEVLAEHGPPDTSLKLQSKLVQVWDLNRAQNLPRLVNIAIPDPTSDPPPEWAGWRGVVSRNGNVYDFETGMRLEPYLADPAQMALLEPKATEKAILDEKTGEAERGTGGLADAIKLPWITRCIFWMIGAEPVLTALFDQRGTFRAKRY